MTTLDTEIVDRLTNFAQQGRHIAINSQTVLALLDYIAKLEQVSMYADSAVLMLAQSGHVGKSEALNERIRSAITAAEYVNKCSTQLNKG